MRKKKRLVCSVNVALCVPVFVFVCKVLAGVLHIMLFVLCGTLPGKSLLMHGEMEHAQFVYMT